MKQNFLQFASFAWIILFWVVVFLTFNFFFARWKLKYDLRRAESDSATTEMLTDAITNHNKIELLIHKDAAKFGEVLSVLNTHVTNSKTAVDRVNAEYSKLSGKIDQVKLLKEG